MLKELMTPHQLADYLVNRSQKTLDGLVASGITRDWDLCFYTQAASRLGAPGLGADVVRAFLELQQSDGRVPQDLAERDGDLHCKPFLAQTLWQAINIDGVPSARTEDLFGKLHQYVQYYETNRRAENRLFFWSRQFESGVNTNIELLHVSGDQALDNYNQIKNRVELLPVDLNSYMVAEFDAMVHLSEIYAPALVPDYLERKEELRDAVNETLWCNSIGLYCNVGASQDIALSLRSWTGLLPVLLGFAPQERSESITKRYILNDEEFLRPYGLASLSVQEMLYSQAAVTREGSTVVPNWRGPMWLLPNLLAARALFRSGKPKGAREVALRCLKALQKDLTESKELHYSYDAETGRGLYSPGHLGWNVLALELIDYIGEASGTAVA